MPQIKSKKSVILLVLLSALFMAYPVFAQDSTPPLTTHEFTGTVGGNGWYTSTVDVVLRTSDFESGPASTAHWLNDEVEIVHNYSTDENPILNPSFENGDPWLGTIYQWDHNSGSATFWRSYLPYAKFGWRSAATLVWGDGTYFWHNRDYEVSLITGGTYTASIWAKTVQLFGGSGAWLEVWAKGSGDWDTDQKIGETGKLLGEVDWELLSHTFVVPEGYDKVYLRLYSEDSGWIGMTFWDGASINGGYEATVNFTLVENGGHTFHYYSTDNDGNVEPTNDVGLKIDTVTPQDWQNFDQEKGGNDHSYAGMIEVRDITSGVDISTAEYAYYTDHQDEQWDHDGDTIQDWYPVSSVTRVSDGQPATDGYTDFVLVRTPEVDFGNSATIMKFQFRIYDMAGNITNSPVVLVLGPWFRMEGRGNFYAAGGVVMQVFPPEGAKNADSLKIIGNNLDILFQSEKTWLLKNYHLGERTALDDFIPNYSMVRDKAVPLPDNKLPYETGIYYYPGGYTIDQNSVTGGFESADFSAIIIIEGDLIIKKEFSLTTDSCAVFLVEGDIQIWNQVEEVSGFFIGTGNFNTNINFQGQQPLLINGSIAMGGQIFMNRDLGRKGGQNNTNTPAEKLIYQPKYLLNNYLSDQMGNSDIEISWGEIGPN